MCFGSGGLNQYLNGQQFNTFNSALVIQGSPSNNLPSYAAACGTEEQLSGLHSMDHFSRFQTGPLGVEHPGLFGPSSMNYYPSSQFVPSLKDQFPASLYPQEQFAGPQFAPSNMGQLAPFGMGQVSGMLFPSNGMGRGMGQFAGAHIPPVGMGQFAGVDIASSGTVSPQLPVASANSPAFQSKLTELRDNVTEGSTDSTSGIEGAAPLASTLLHVEPPTADKPTTPSGVETSAGGRILKAAAKEKPIPTATKVGGRVRQPPQPFAGMIPSVKLPATRRPTQKRKATP